MSDAATSDAVDGGEVLPPGTDPTGARGGQARHVQAPGGPAPWPPADLGDSFGLRFSVAREALHHAFQAVRLPHTHGVVTLSVTDGCLVLSRANDTMRCERALPLREPSGLPPGCAVDLETEADLFDKILCDRGRPPVAGAKVAVVAFATDEDVSLLEAVERVGQARRLAIRDGRLSITWPFVVCGLRPSTARPERTTARDTTAHALGAAIELVRGYAGRNTGNSGHDQVGVAAGAAVAGTGRARCIARLAGLGAAELDLDSDAAAVLAALASHFVPPTQTWASATDQGLRDAAGECVVLSGASNPDPRVDVSVPDTRHVARLSAETFARAVMQALAQLPRGTGEVTLRLTAAPPDTITLTLIVPVELGDAVVTYPVTLASPLPEEATTLHEGVLSARHLKQWRFHNFGTEIELRVLDQGLHIKEVCDGGGVDTYIPWTV